MLYDCVEEVDVEGIVRFIKSLQRPDGSFIGDKWGVQEGRGECSEGDM